MQSRETQEQVKGSWGPTLGQWWEGWRRQKWGRDMERPAEAPGFHSLTPRSSRPGPLVSDPEVEPEDTTAGGEELGLDGECEEFSTQHEIQT